MTAAPVTSDGDCPGARNGRAVCVIVLRELAVAAAAAARRLRRRRRRRTRERCGGGGGGGRMVGVSAMGSSAAIAAHWLLRVALGEHGGVCPLPPPSIKQTLPQSINPPGGYQVPQGKSL